MWMEWRRQIQACLERDGVPSKRSAATSVRRAWSLSKGMPGTRRLTDEDRASRGGRVLERPAARLRARAQKPAVLAAIRRAIQVCALLHEGSIDFGMIPSIEYLRGHLHIVTSLAIVRMVRSLGGAFAHPCGPDPNDCLGYQLTHVLCTPARAVRERLASSRSSSHAAGSGGDAAAVRRRAPHRESRALSHPTRSARKKSISVSSGLR